MRKFFCILLVVLSLFSFIPSSYASNNFQRGTYTGKRQYTSSYDNKISSYEYTIIFYDNKAIVYCIINNSIIREFPKIYNVSTGLSDNQVILFNDNEITYIDITDPNNYVYYDNFNKDPIPVRQILY